MIQLFYSPYELKPLESPNALSAATKPRSGALLKVEWSEGLRGYADLHPWPELGDSPLEDQLLEVRKGRISSQIEQSIWLARRDAELRKVQKNIFDEGDTVRNNFLLADYRSLKPGYLDEVKSEGFSTVKMKVGRNLKEELEALTLIAAAKMRIRLDFNAVGSWQIFERFMSQVPPSVRPLIEYVEDPFPYEEKAWAEARKLIPIALDNQYHRVPWDTLSVKSFDVLVLKPAKMDVEKTMQRALALKTKVTVTNYMDHPVGSVHALGIAMELKRKWGDLMLDCGCLTHRLFQMNSFSAEMNIQGPYLKRFKGSGVGFDKLLETQPWQPLTLS